MSKEPHYWFPAKRYGWGWGLPTCWQGWLVLLGFSAGLAVGLLFLPHRPLYRIGCPLLLTAMLLLICRWKGEPPAWRWGERREE